jgi:hypothetical protein
MDSDSKPQRFVVKNPKQLGTISMKLTEDTANE